MIDDIRTVNRMIERNQLRAMADEDAERRACAVRGAARSVGDE